MVGLSLVSSLFPQNLVSKLPAAIPEAGSKLNQN
jgi:hypothetical protein